VCAQTKKHDAKYLKAQQILRAKEGDKELMMWVKKA
jgi:hypothetical protein